MEGRRGTQGASFYRISIHRITAETPNAKMQAGGGDGVENRRGPGLAATRTDSAAASSMTDSCGWEETIAS